MIQVLLHSSNHTLELNQWFSANGGEGLRVALQGEASDILDKVEQADLRGMGGSGFPTHRKWRLMAEQQASPDKYLICNGNEDEPGTFKDCYLLEHTPHQVIEGALITALANKINKIVFYINPMQRKSVENMQKAVAQWEASIWLDKITQCIGKSIELDIVETSGLYIGGEETAAIETVEGKFPFPRGKPPFPAIAGVHRAPTLINNIETIANVSHIMRNSIEWYQDLGQGDCSGTKLYCLSGDVLKPGIYELPMGTALKELIYSYGGGMLLDKELKAVFTGGASSTILTSKDIDVALDFESVRARGSSLGTGAMIVVSEGTGIVKQITEYINFYAHSSCGQCPSCKSGTFYLSQLLNRIDTGEANRADLQSLYNLCNILPGSGRCQLLDGALKIIDSSLQHFQSEYEESLRF